VTRQSGISPGRLRPRRRSVSPTESHRLTPCPQVPNLKLQALDPKLQTVSSEPEPPNPEVSVLRPAPWTLTTHPVPIIRPQVQGECGPQCQRQCRRRQGGRAPGPPPREIPKPTL